MARISLDEQLLKAQRRLDQLKQKKENRERRELAAQKERQRKLDVRRKIVVGGHLLKLVAEGDADAVRLQDRILSQMNERDAALFADVDNGTGIDAQSRHEKLLARYIPVPSSIDVSSWTAYVQNRAELALQILELGDPVWAEAAAARFREAVKQWEAATSRTFSTDILADFEEAA
ncbi:MAG TPA: hypothetical protein VF628_10305 [Allosphingosinicella sp.]|jgi:hypothetical protein